MAVVLYRNSYFWVNNVDYSSNVAELALNYSAEMLDRTYMSADTRIMMGGLKVWEVTGKAHQDFAAGNIGANFWSLVGTTVCFELRRDNSCTTVVNPSFYGIGILENAPPVAGAVGTLLDTVFTIRSAGSISRASSS